MRNLPLPHNVNPLPDYELLQDGMMARARHAPNVSEQLIGKALWNIHISGNVGTV